MDPVAERLECHALTGREYRPVVEAQGDARLTHPAFEALELDLAALWR